MGRAVGRFLRASGAAAAVAVLVTLGVVGQVDPRNSSDEYFDAVNGAKCYEHHEVQGFNALAFRFEEAYSELPVQETVPVRVQVFHDTKYTVHQLRDITVTVDTRDAPNVQIVTPDLPDDVEQVETVQVASRETTGFDEVFIGQGAREGRFSVEVVETDPPLHAVGAPGRLVVDAAGEVVESDEGSAVVDLDEGFFEAVGTGNHSFSATWIAPDSMVPMTATLEVALWVNFTQESTRFTFASPDLLRSDTDRTLVEVPVRFVSTGPALLDFEVRVIAHWPHEPGDGAPMDDGEYHRFLAMQVEGGEERVVARQVAAPAPVGQSVDLYNLFTRLLGFIGLFLVAAALFTGGVFGKGSRRWMNRFTGGAKKRVLWHSAMGFLIVVVATVHFALALVESLHDFSKGLLWGGLAWVLLISLGFTGYYQVRMIRKWDYRVWRHVHLWSAVAVLLFVLMHALLDGSDFDAVREMLPSGYDKWIWPRP